MGNSNMEDPCLFAKHLTQATGKSKDLDTTYLARLGTHCDNPITSRVYAWSGRPDWKQVFSVVRRQSAETVSVGVTFCGAEVIAKDLRKRCVESNAQRGARFYLHKEAF